jgi:hypothetical protein
MNNQNTFNNNDYNSKDGMLTTVWGPSLWHSLHTISFNYPTNPTPEQKHKYLSFFKSLRHILPCKYCRDNYLKNLKRVPLTMTTMKNRLTLSKWLYHLHEEINNMLGKKSGLTYEDVRNRYEMFRARCVDEKSGSKKEHKPKKISKKKKPLEKGCTTPYYGKKSQCVINIVPKTKKCKSFKIDKRCIIKKRIREKEKSQK